MFFNLDSILNEKNKKVEYEINQQNLFTVKMKQISQSLTFVFKRK